MITGLSGSSVLLCWFFSSIPSCYFIYWHCMWKIEIISGRMISFCLGKESRSTYDPGSLGSRKALRFWSCIQFQILVHLFSECGPSKVRTFLLRRPWTPASSFGPLFLWVFWKLCSSLNLGIGSSADDPLGKAAPNARITCVSLLLHSPVISHCLVSIQVFVLPSFSSF